MAVRHLLRCLADAEVIPRRCHARPRHFADASAKSSILSRAGKIELKERAAIHPMRTYRFVIDAWSPARLPMARLAEYMADLAGLLGAPEHVHFDRLESGSAVLVQHVDPKGVLSVEERLEYAATSHRPPDIAKRCKSIDDRLAEDDATATLRQSDGAEILRFPGRERQEPPTFGPFRQDGCFDGILIRVGGKDDTVPVHLQDGDLIHTCNATREMARRLAPYLFGGTIRVQGNGRWKRDADGNWVLLRFDIKHFEVLDDTPLPKVVGELREVPGSGWGRIKDPLTELRHLREETEHDH